MEEIDMYCENRSKWHVMVRTAIMYATIMDMYPVMLHR